jgi:hypothetical protein
VRGAALFVVAATLLFALLWLVVSPALAMVSAVVSLAYTLNLLLRAAQQTRDDALPQSRRWWAPW